MTPPIITPDVAEALRLHYLAADKRVKLLTISNAGLAPTIEDIEAKHDAENDLANHLVQMRETIRREALEEAKRLCDEVEEEEWDACRKG